MKKPALITSLIVLGFAVLSAILAVSLQHADLRPGYVDIRYDKKFCPYALNQKALDVKDGCIITTVWYNDDIIKAFYQPVDAPADSIKADSLKAAAILNNLRLILNK